MKHPLDDIGRMDGFRHHSILTCSNSIATEQLTRPTNKISDRTFYTVCFRVLQSRVIRRAAFVGVGLFMV